MIFCHSRVGWANGSIVCPRGTIETVGKQKDACPPYETVIAMMRSVFGFAEASLPDISVGLFTDMIFFLLVG
ncbi:MAG: hypothetical protein WCK96_08270 [Methylococcales bacterium]